MTISGILGMGAGGEFKIDSTIMKRTLRMQQMYGRRGKIRGLELFAGRINSIMKNAPDRGVYRSVRLDYLGIGATGAAWGATTPYGAGQAAGAGIGTAAGIGMAAPAG